MAYEKAMEEFRSRVSDPKVTLDDDGRGVPEEALDTGFIHWLTLVNAHGDDGKRYFLEFVEMTGIAEAGVDIWMLEVGSETGTVEQIPGSIYKLANYPFQQAERKTFPAGTLKLTRNDDHVAIDLPDFHIECHDDNTWRYWINDRDHDVQFEMIHHGVGFPTWYGKEKPKYLTAHAIAYGYNWAGRIEGTLTMQGRKVKLTGAALRERYVAIDQSAAEIGGWEDWMWFHFDELFGSFYEQKFSGVKEIGLNIVDGGAFYPVGDLQIEHHEWAFHPRLGAFVPTRYKMSVQVEDGRLDLHGDIVESKLWGMRGGVPDAPLYTHNFDRLAGRFTYNDGRVIELDNGYGGGCVRLWKPYPSILMPHTGDEFTPYADRVLLFE